MRAELPTSIWEKSLEPQVRSSDAPHCSFFEGMPAVAGALQLLSCKQAQLSDEDDSYFVLSTLFYNTVFQARGVYLTGSQCRCWY